MKFCAISYHDSADSGEDFSAHSVLDD